MSVKNPLDDHGTGGGLVLERTPSRQKAKPPPQFAVIMLNDDFTPVDFVVAVLVDIFRKPMDEAEAITMDVHKQGKGVAGIYTKDIAETKVTQVHRVAHEHQHPFRCDIQAVE